MKKRSLLLFGLFYASSQVHAVTLDLRHEWTDDSKLHQDRVLVSHRFANGIGFALETKWKSGGNDSNKAFNDVVSNGSESSLGYQYLFAPKTFIEPGFTFESASDKSIYKPYLYAGRAFDSGVYFNGRYRYEYTRETQDGKDDMKTHRGEIWLGYRIRSWRVEYNYIYKHSDKIRFDNKKWDYEHNIKAVWRYDKNWSPYGELGNVSVRPTSDERQTRLRIGIQYVF